MKASFSLSVVLAISLSLVSAPLPAGTYSGGDGQSATPFRISTPDDWAELLMTDADWSAHFVLTANLDLSSIAMLIPVALDGPAFSGVFDGAGFAVSNVTIDLPEELSIALFSGLSAGGEIKNLTLVNADITGGFDVAALVGTNAGTITNCSAAGQVEGLVSVGGLVGSNVGGTITRCSAVVDTNSNHNPATVGGLCGYSDDDSLIENSCAAGNVHGSGDEVGGLVGKNNSTIQNCCATGNVGGLSHDTGGLVGRNSSTGSIQNCYATGSVSTEYGELGGLVGYNQGRISDCYATGDGIIYDSGVFGGLIGYNETLPDALTANFWDTQTSGTTTGIGDSIGGGGEESIGDRMGMLDADPVEVTGKTTVEMQTKSTFTGAEWDFASVWVIPIGHYPLLQPRLAGDVDMDDQVNLIDLAILAENWLKGG